MKLTTVDCYQCHVTLMTMRRSLVQRSRSARDGHRSLVNAIALEPINKQPKNARHAFRRRLLSIVNFELAVMFPNKDNVREINLSEAHYINLDINNRQYSSLNTGHSGNVSGSLYTTSIVLNNKNSIC